MNERIVNFYRNLLILEEEADQAAAETLLNYIPNLISEEDNHKITTSFTEEEIRFAILV